MMTYLLTSAAWLAFFYCCYRLFLERETFFQLNRWMLVGSVILAFSLPLWQVPEAWSLQKRGEGRGERGEQEVLANTPNLLDSDEAPAEAIRQIPQAIANQPTEAADQESTLLLTAAENSKEPIVANTSAPTWSWSFVFWYIYVWGAFLMLLYFLYQFLLLAYHSFFGEGHRFGKHRIVHLKKPAAPFSFWNSIFIHPQQYDRATYEQIIRHESIHLQQRHSLDMLLAEGLLIVQWFNPFAWLYRRSIEKNLEFLTDKSMLAAGEDRQSYQYSLLRVSLPQYAFSLTNKYSQSTLKQRIMMMNTNKSKRISLLKYLGVLAMIVIAALVFNPVKASVKASVKAWQDAPQKEQITPVEDTQEEPTVAVPDKAANPTQTAPSVTSEGGDGQHTYSITYSDFAGEIPFKGVWDARIEGDEVCVNFRNTQEEGRGYYWSSHRCFARSEFSALPTGADAEFEIKREAGTMTFTGSFRGNEGEGRYVFTENPAFKTLLTKEGYRNVEEELYLFCFLSDVNQEYFAYLKQMDLRPEDSDELKKMAIHGLTLPYLKETLPAYAQMGFKDLDVKKLVKLKIHDVSPDYIAGLKKMGFGDVSLEMATKASIHDVELEYVEGLAKAGYTGLSLEQVIKASIHDVDLEYVQRLGQMGYNNLSLEEVMKASIHDVDADYVEELHALGYSNLPLERIVKASIHDVDTDYVRELQEMGFTNLSLEEVIKASIHDVDLDFVRQLKEAGYTNLSLDEIMKASIHDVSGKFIKSLADMGYTNLSLDDVSRAAIHDVDERYVRMLNEKGYDKLPLDDVIRASIHDVDAGFISGLNELGFKNIPIDQLIQLRIHDVTANYIRNSGKKGLSLDEYKRMKIHGRRYRAE